MIKAGIKSATLKDLSGKSSVDIMSIIAELDVFEDLYSSTMSATVTIFDTNNLINQFPIIGEEILDIEYETENLNTVFKRFYVYKLSNRIQQQDHKMIYVLHLLSYEGIIDLNTKISRAFSGYTHDIAKNIFEKYIATDQFYSGKKLMLEDSGTEIKFVSPYWSPIRCINHAATRSTITKNWRSPSFLFFESSEAFKFTSIESLVKQTPIINYFFDSDPMRNPTAQGGSERDVARWLSTVINLNIEQHFDYIQKVMTGMITHQTIEHDIIHKTIRNHRYDYATDFSKHAHLEDNPMNSNKLMFSEKTAVVDTRSIFSYGFNERIKDNSAESVHKRNSLLPQLEMFKVQMTVPGRSDVKVGDVVNLKLGKGSSLDAEKITQEANDLYYSGKYLITGIQHRLTPSRHEMIVELIKDSTVKVIE
jgi:hypothetical protein